MLFALMLTCGWGRWRLRAYASRSLSAEGTSVMLMLFVIVSAVTVPRGAQAKLCTTPTWRTGCIVGWPGTGCAIPPPCAAALPGDGGQLRVRRSFVKSAAAPARGEFQPKFRGL